MICRRLEADVGEELGHTRSVGEMAVEEVRNVDVLEIGDVLDRSETGDGLQASARRAEEVTEKPVIHGEAIDKPPRDDTSHLTPDFIRSGDGRAEEVDFLDDAEGVVLGELDEGEKDDARAEGESDEGDGTDAETAVEENVREDLTRLTGAVESVGPGVVDEVGELGEHCGRRRFSKKLK